MSDLPALPTGGCRETGGQQAEERHPPRYASARSATQPSDGGRSGRHQNHGRSQAVGGVSIDHGAEGVRRRGATSDLVAERRCGRSARQIRDGRRPGGQQKGDRAEVDDSGSPKQEAGESGEATGDGKDDRNVVDREMEQRPVHAQSSSRPAISWMLENSRIS
ncbi:MAG: hypothetical protein V3T25_05590 [Gemmatimonadota bacterium]